jgi:Chaperone of endosialidase
MKQLSLLAALLLITTYVTHAQNVGIGTDSASANLHVSGGNGPVSIYLEADKNNSGEGNQPEIRFSQDGGIVKSRIGYMGSTNSFSIMQEYNGNMDFYTDSTVRMTINYAGNVGIGTTTPGFPLSFPDSLGDKIALWGQFGSHYGFGIQPNELQIYSALSVDDITFGYGNSGAFTENMRIKGNGNVGIGTTTPGFPLSFSNSFGDKISLSGQSGSHYGFGIQSNEFQVYSALSVDDITFGYGTSANFTENVRIKGNGNVGIGTSNPEFPLSFSSDYGDKISLLSLAGTHYGIGVDTGELQIYTNVSGTDITFGYKTSGEFTENMIIKGYGNVGIGTSYPWFPLSFSSDYGDKISLWTFFGDHYGFGVDTNELQVYTNMEGSDITFGYGKSASFTENMRIKGNGNVGIGTSNPEFLLSFANSLGDKIALWGNTADHYGFGIQGGELQVYSNASGSDITFGYGNSAAFTENMRIKGNGNVGIGTSNPIYPLHMASGAHVTAAGVWTNVSDISKKYEIADLGYGLGEILKMRPASYRYKADGSKSIGFIAQEMEQIIPEVVSGDDGEKGIAYGPLASVIVHGIQQQQEVIEQLRIENAQFKIENAQLRIENAQMKMESVQMQTQLAEVVSDLAGIKAMLNASVVHD